MHIQKRLLEAKEINLIPDNFDLDFSSSICFTPNVNHLPEVNDSINEILNINIKPGWNYRRNEIANAAKWISEEVRDDFLILDGGYSKMGDRSIEKIQHKKNGEGVLFMVSTNAPVDEIASLLRQSISRRILGRTNNFFICDAFDCDSIIVISRLVT